MLNVRSGDNNWNGLRNLLRNFKRNRNSRAGTEEQGENRNNGREEECLIRLGIRNKRKFQSIYGITREVFQPPRSRRFFRVNDSAKVRAARAWSKYILRSAGAKAGSLNRQDLREKILSHYTRKKIFSK